MIEAVREGWWYTAALPGGRRVVAFMSDADIVRRLELRAHERWMRALDETEHVRAAVACAAPAGPPSLQGAGSQLVTGDTAQSLIGEIKAAGRKRAGVDSPQDYEDHEILASTNGSVANRT